MAFDSIEPIDAAGVILRGLSGDGSAKSESSGGWEDAYSRMSKLAHVPDKLIVPKGKTPEQVWRERK